jgi:hypothetical protein
MEKARAMMEMEQESVSSSRNRADDPTSRGVHATVERWNGSEFFPGGIRPFLSCDNGTVRPLCFKVLN